MISGVEAWLVVLIAGLVLVGWQFNIEQLKRVVPSFVAMNPLTALCLIVAGIALLLVKTQPVAKQRRWEVRALGFGVAVIGALVLMRYLLHVSFMPDRALFSSKLDVPGQIPNAMAPNTALGFVIIGASLILVDARPELARRLSQYLAGLLAFLSSVALLGYAYGNRSLLAYKAFIPIAVHSAVCFMLLSTAILLARPQEGLMRLFSSEGGAGFMVRRLLVPAVLLPAILGWIRLQGQKEHLYGTEMGVALTIASNIFIGCILVWIAGYVLDKKEREINQAKDDFLGLAAHQLRTPATSVRLGLAMIEEGMVGKVTGEQAEIVQKALEACDQETHLINDLLNVARAEAGRMELVKVPTDLGKLVRHVIQTQQSIIDSRKQQIVVTSPSLHVLADADKLGMAIGNLVNNASKYTPDGGKLSVTVREGGNRVLVEVADNGVGMAPEDIPKIFTKFTRLSNPLSRNRGGTGLGIYLVKQIIELHGGEVTATSELGKGSRFTIELPDGNAKSNKNE